MMRMIRLVFAMAIVGVAAGAIGLMSRVTAATDDAPKAIRAVLEKQVVDWNRADVPAFMQGYWNSDETEFVGSNGITRGWHAVLDRYRKTYPDAKAMGTLSFANLEIRMIGPDTAYVLGEFHLQRESDNPAGVFTLIVRKFPEGWRVIHDHSTGYSEAKH
jgi:ketosteroid isomerase-like protein